MEKSDILDEIDRIRNLEIEYHDKIQQEKANLIEMIIEMDDYEEAYRFFKKMSATPEEFNIGMWEFRDRYVNEKM